MNSTRLLNVAAIAFLLAIVVTVFVQIETSMKEQGIASGGPYDNAATYPRTVAILIGVLLCVQIAAEFFRKPSGTGGDVVVPDRAGLVRAASMLAVFAVYLAVLTTIGYHLATTPMILAILFICGARNYLVMAAASIAIAFGFAFAFEKFLNVVLPLGIWSIFIPW